MIFVFVFYLYICTLCIICIIFLKISCTYYKIYYRYIIYLSPQGDERVKENLSVMSLSLMGLILYWCSCWCCDC